MNKTNFEHAGFALMMQSVFLLLGVFVFDAVTTLAWIGAAFASAFFLGREHAQREYKLGDPSKLMGHEAFDIWRWKLDAVLDLVFPVVASVAVALVVQFLL